MPRKLSSSLIKRKIRFIQKLDISNEEKQKRIHKLIYYNPIKKKLTNKNISYRNKSKKTIGCKHYEQNCKLFMKCCNNWYVCKRCHDDTEDHRVEIKDIEKISCMKCKTEQNISNKCINCNIKFAKYFCRYCKYYNNENMDIYHCFGCKKCNIGIMEEHKHCNTCNVCMEHVMYNMHNCKKNVLDSDCPICKEYLNNSASPVMVLANCQHSIHVKCFTDYIKNGAFVCPICKKSITDLDLNKKIYETIETLLDFEYDQIPEDLINRRTHILCNDCSLESIVPFHFDYHKCQHANCLSFNTSIIRYLD